MKKEDILLPHAILEQLNAINVDAYAMLKLLAGDSSIDELRVNVKSVQESQISLSCFE